MPDTQIDRLFQEQSNHVQNIQNSVMSQKLDGKSFYKYFLIIANEES